MIDVDFGQQIPLNDTINTTTTNTSYIPSTSLLDMSHLTEHTLNRNNSSSDGSQRNNNKRKKVKLPSCSTLYKQKIQITKEIFSLYMHQFFRNLEKMQSDRRDRILPSSFASSSTSVLGVLQSDRAEKSSIGVTLDEIKEDKNLKWLAEIYARNEAKRLAILHQAQDTSTCSEPPKPKKRYFDTDGAESSIINPTSSPAYSTRSTPRPRATAMMVDTTNISSISSASSSSSSTTKTNKKIKVEAGIVDKIRNDLFRNTILKLVKDGIIIVYTADLSTPKPPPLVQLRAKECVVCMKKIEIELEKIPPIMTMEGIPLRELRAKQMKEENCQCPSKARIQSRPSEETYALLTSGMLLPVVERIVSRIDHGNELLVEQVWNAVKGQDDMWRFVSKELVKECMEMV